MSNNKCREEWKSSKYLFKKIFGTKCIFK